jgi:flagellar basal-body rod protein FlgF
MQSGTYVALSGQLALQRRLETIAYNVANTNTVGFRSEQVKFETILSRVPIDPIAFSSTGAPTVSQHPGALIQTGNPLDVAIEGEGWLAILTPAGQVLTRDGRMRMTEAGELQTLSGFPVLDVGGVPIQLDPNGGPIIIARDGTITQNNLQVGALGLFRIPDNAILTRYDNSGFLLDRRPEPIINFVQDGVVQGYVEKANVNAVEELSQLILVSRSFDAVTAALNETDLSLREAIRTINGSS